MKILKLVLSGYKRLMLNNIKCFTYTPTSSYQLILGTNGSGKSSILEELSPNPAVQGNYIKGGFKVIELEMGVDTYILESNFTSGAKHSFLKNGEELNPGGTGAVQKELVKQVFNYTAKLHGLVSGTEAFTTMSTERRREILTALSDTDLTYALGVYGRLKTASRDSIGAFKHINARLTSESSKLLTLSEAQGLQERATALHADISVLMDNKENNLPDKAGVSGQLSNALNEITKLSNEIMNTNFTMPAGYQFTSLDDVDKVILEFTNKKTVGDSLIQHYAAELDELQRFIDALKASGFSAVEDMWARIEELGHETTVLKNNFDMFHLTGDVANIKRVTENVISPLIGVLNNLPDNSDRRYTRETLAKAYADQASDADQMERLVPIHRQLRIRIEHIESSKETNCPKCSYVWREGYSELELNGLKDKLIKAEERMAELNTSKLANEKFIEEALAYSKTFAEYKWLVDNNPGLEMLWDKLTELGCPMRDPRSYIPMFSIWQRDMQNADALYAAQTELDKLKAAVKTAEQVGDTDSDHFCKRSEELTQKVELATEQVIACVQELKVLNKYRNDIGRATQTGERLEALIRDANSKTELMVRIHRRNVIDETLGAAQGVLGGVQNQLNELTAVQGIVTDLQRSSDKLGIDVDAYKLILAELSPSEGLIAESLTGFIECFTAQMNEIIAQVWTYEMEVLPCGLASGELDYKFPLQIVRSDITAPDVSKGSKAQTEIVDFAFKLVLMLYLNMSNYPLLVDELGGGFDEQHRVNVMNYVKLLIDSKRYSQLFMISHYASSHGSMTQAEICVLDSSNIVVPHIHNKHVKLE